MKKEQERKLERQISKAMSELHLFMSCYVGDRQIERGDTISHEELWKRLKKKFKFKLSDKEKVNIRNDIRNRITASSRLKSLEQYVFGLIENRDELFKKPQPKKYPGRYYI